MQALPGYTDVVYGRYARGSGARVWLQYWLFYLFNDKSLGRHRPARGRLGDGAGRVSTTGAPPARRSRSTAAPRSATTGPTSARRRERAGHRRWSTSASARMRRTSIRPVPHRPLPDARPCAGQRPPGAPARRRTDGRRRLAGMARPLGAHRPQRHVESSRAAAAREAVEAPGRVPRRRTRTAAQLGPIYVAVPGAAPYPLITARRDGDGVLISYDVRAAEEPPARLLLLVESTDPHEAPSTHSFVVGARRATVRHPARIGEGDYVVHATALGAEDAASDTVTVDVAACGTRRADPCPRGLRAAAAGRARRRLERRSPRAAQGGPRRPRYRRRRSALGGRIPVPDDPRARATGATAPPHEGDRSRDRRARVPAAAAGIRPRPPAARRDRRRRPARPPVQRLRGAGDVRRSARAHRAQARRSAAPMPRTGRSRRSVRPRRGSSSPVSAPGSPSVTRTQGSRRTRSSSPRRWTWRARGTSSTTTPTPAIRSGSDRGGHWTRRATGLRRAASSPAARRARSRVRRRASRSCRCGRSTASSRSSTATSPSRSSERDAPVATRLDEPRRRRVRGRGAGRDQDRGRSGMIVMAAAGNEVGFVTAPASWPECLAIGGIGITDAPWPGSSHGRHVDFCAPAEGVWVATARRENGRAVFTVEPHDGTSFAVANTAGAAALWLAHHGAETLRHRYGRENVQRLVLTLARRTARTPDDWDSRNYGAGDPRRPGAPGGVAARPGGLRPEDDPRHGNDGHGAGSAGDAVADLTRHRCAAGRPADGPARRGAR